MLSANRLHEKYTPAFIADNILDRIQEDAVKAWERGSTRFAIHAPTTTVADYLKAALNLRGFKVEIHATTVIFDMSTSCQMIVDDQNPTFYLKVQGDRICGELGSVSWPTSALSVVQDKGIMPYLTKPQNGIGFRIHD